MANHVLKLRMEYWNAVHNGEKCFEIRENDRGYQKTDTVQFQMVDKEGKIIESPINCKITFEITYVLPGYALKDGWVVFGIKKKEEPVVGHKLQPLVNEARETDAMKMGRIAHDMMNLKPTERFDYPRWDRCITKPLKEPKKKRVIKGKKKRK